MVGNGARIRRIDLTTNRTVGKGNVMAYIRALSTQRYGYKNAHLYEDGLTCDWKARDHYERPMRKARPFASSCFPSANAISAKSPPSSAISSAWPITATTRASFGWSKNSRVSFSRRSGWSGGDYSMSSNFRPFTKVLGHRRQARGNGNGLQDYR